MKLLLVAQFSDLMNKNSLCYEYNDRQPLGSEKGGRLNNEDSIFPPPETANSNQNLFLVCDGVGGAEKGEIASSLACESFQTFFSTFREGEPNADFINKAIRYTEARFDDYVAIHPEAKGMATTLTMIFIGTTGITLAHGGQTDLPFPERRNLVPD